MTRIAAVAVTLLAVALALFGTLTLRGATTSTLPAAPPGAPARHLPATVAGIVSNNLTKFDAQCGCRPDTAVHYVRWGEDPAISQRLAAGMISDGASPLLEIAPFGRTLSAITAGHDDKWLRAYAIMVRSLKSQVLLSFAPESNGWWYSWGWPNVKPAAEVAAWRHVVTVFRSEDVRSARWVWIANQLWPGSGPLPQLWPGASYVDEVGIDGYFHKASDTFASVFGPTITAAHQFAPGKPVLITETGAAPQAGKLRVVHQLASGVVSYGLDGFVWFDINQGSQQGLGKADWSLSDDPAALAAYRAAVKEKR
jgi:Glycosyl hydrolase family 26